jgi:hypothetical protein
MRRGSISDPFSKAGARRRQETTRPLIGALCLDVRLVKTRFPGDEELNNVGTTRSPGLRQMMARQKPDLLQGSL